MKRVKSNVGVLNVRAGGECNCHCALYVIRLMSCNKRLNIRRMLGPVMFKT